jgi:hypothetical protein
MSFAKYFLNGAIETSMALYLRFRSSGGTNFMLVSIKVNIHNTNNEIALEVTFCK